MNFKGYLLWTLISLFMAGCIAKPLPKISSGAVWAESPSLDKLLKDYERINNLSEADFKVELAHFEKTSAESMDIMSKLRLVLLYLRAGEGHKRDFSRADRILVEIEQQAAPLGEAGHGFVELLKMFILEQKQLQVKIAGLNNEIHGFSQKNSDLEQKLHNSRLQAEALAQQIEQLKKIERIMSKRQDEKTVSDP